MLPDVFAFRCKLNLLFFLGLYSGSAVAGNIDISLAHEEIHYREFSESTQLVSEKGPGKRLKVAHEWTLKESWHVGLSVQALNAWLTYNGQTQLGVALSTDTHLQHRSVALNGGYTFNWGALTLSPNAEVARPCYQRSIQQTATTSPARFLFDWYQASVGFVVGASLSSSWRARMKVVVAQPLSGKAHLDFSGAGFAKKSVGLNGGGGESIELTLDYSLSPRSQFSVSVVRELWRWDESDSTTFNSPIRATFVEPISKKVSRAFELSLSYSY